MRKIKELFRIFYVFSILGLQMFGNLATMVPIFEEELIKKRRIISKNDLLDSISLGRCGPRCSDNKYSSIFRKFNMWYFRGNICSFRFYGISFYNYNTNILLHKLLSKYGCIK